MSEYRQPAYRENTFSCPHCSVVASQQWAELEHLPTIPPGTDIAQCINCKEYSMWHQEKIVYPTSGNAPLPHPDLPERLKENYEEARDTVTRSPRSASALLRLLIEKLANDILGDDKGRDLNDSIGKLAARGLPERVAKMFDVVRYRGNESVHPGEIDNSDDSKTALSLFKLVNLIVEKVIVEPKVIDSLYDDLPEKVKEGISNRNNHHASKKAKRSNSVD